MKKIVVDNLVVEITRKCNAGCAHCLRGCAENVNISRKAMKQLFENIDAINIITFTGGEPSLYVQAIREALNICKERGISVCYIYVVTNGVKYSKGLINVMNDWANYCMQSLGYDYTSYEDRKYYFEEGIFGLSLSIDAFHPKFDTRCYEYKDLPYYSNAKEVNNYGSGLILEGRAAENFERGRFLKDYELTFSFMDMGDYEMPEMVYCNCFGEIFPCCDMSYERQRDIAKVSKINILERTLEDILYDSNINYIGRSVAV